MLSILFLIAFLIILGITWVKDWSEGWAVCSAISAFIALIAILFLLLGPTTTKDQITEYNTQKTIYYNLNYPNIPELRKVKLLSKLIYLDGKMRYYLKQNKKFLYDLYYDDEDIAGIVLVKGWN